MRYKIWMTNHFALIGTQGLQLKYSPIFVNGIESFLTLTTQDSFSYFQRDLTDFSTFNDMTIQFKILKIDSSNENIFGPLVEMSDGQSKLKCLFTVNKINIYGDSSFTYNISSFPIVTRIEKNDHTYSIFINENIIATIMGSTPQDPDKFIRFGHQYSPLQIYSEWSYFTWIHKDSDYTEHILFNEPIQNTNPKWTYYGTYLTMENFLDGHCNTQWGILYDVTDLNPNTNYITYDKLTINKNQVMMVYKIEGDKVQYEYPNNVWNIIYNTYPEYEYDIQSIFALDNQRDFTVPFHLDFSIRNFDIFVSGLYMAPEIDYTQIHPNIIRLTDPCIKDELFVIKKYKGKQIKH